MEDEWTFTFSTPRSPESWLRKLKAVTAGLEGAHLWGVLISVPGIVDEVQGKVLFSPNLHWLEKANLPRLVGQVWPLPVLLVQEIRALALGQLSAGPGGEDFFLVDFGQGVGGAIVLNGKLYSHPNPLSGEFGHTPVSGNQRLCGCGAVGCLETLVSERGLLESFRRASGRGSETGGWTELARRVSARGLEPWLSATLDATAKVISGALNVLGIHRVVVTGRLTELPGCVRRLGALIKEGAMWGRFGDVVCQSAPHRRAAGLVGFGIDRLILPANEEKGLIVNRPK
jgi:predicted NBD/HSP70 family sugar kinase